MSKFSPDGEKVLLGYCTKRATRSSTMNPMAIELCKVMNIANKAITDS